MLTTKPAFRCLRALAVAAGALLAFPSHAGAATSPLSASALRSAAAKIHLHSVAAADGSGTAMVPDGWSVTLLKSGQFVASGPGASVAWGVGDTPSTPYIADPARAFTVTTEAQSMLANGTNPHIRIERTMPLRAQVGNAAFVYGTEMQGATRLRFAAVVVVTPPAGVTGWSITSEAITAADASFVQMLPAMLAVVTDYQPNLKGNVSGLVPIAQGSRQDLAHWSAWVAR